MTTRPDDDEKKKDSFEFDNAGEERAYISLDQARIQAMSSAREAPGEYGRLSKSPMFFEVVEASETEDFYEVTLSFRPQGNFTGTSGQEQFFISKDGELEHRQVMSLPQEEPSDAPDSREEVSGNSRRSTLMTTGILVAIVAAVVGTAIAFGGFGNDGEAPIEPALVANNPPTALPVRTQTALVTQPTSVAPTIALPIILQSPTPQPTVQASPLEPIATQTATPTSSTPMFTPAPVSTSKFRIAFESNRVIYVMNADGSGQTRLTSNGTRDGYPAWSPDGTKIAFISSRDGNREIHVMNADGSGQTRLTNNEAYDITPVWSPDGMKIAFGSDRDGNFEIYVMNVDGSGQTRLTNNDARDSNPAWSPR